MWLVHSCYQVQLTNVDRCLGYANAHSDYPMVRLNVTLDVDLLADFPHFDFDSYWK